MNEFDLIKRYFRDRAMRKDVVLGPGDDSALLVPPADQELVMTMDTLITGVHFPPDMPPRAMGFRALATNLSDLAAMGAEPAWCLLSLSVPESDQAWLDAFCSGFFALADHANVSLVGGDMVRGPLSITIQATGFVPTGAALTRAGAQVGDRIVIGGVPGEAAAGFEQWESGIKSGRLIDRFCYPEPQIELGLALRGKATAAIDVSDGLLADLGHILQESGDLGADIHLEQLPPVRFEDGTPDQANMHQWQLAGGDDYLLLFTLPEGEPLPDECIDIGCVTDSGTILLVDAEGTRQAPTAFGWTHF